MPLSKKRKREYQKALYWQRKRQASSLLVTKIMSSADVRAIRKAGLKPEDAEGESGKVSSRLFYALLRDRDAIKAHLSWHHDMVGKPDVGTMIEQLQARVTLLEADFTLHEATKTYNPDACHENPEPDEACPEQGRRGRMAEAEYTRG